LKFQCFRLFSPALFVHPVSCFKKDITAVTVEISTVTAVFTNSFCPISQKAFAALKFESNYDTVLVELDEPMILKDHNPDAYSEETEYIILEQYNYYAMPKDGEFTLGNVAKKGENVYITAGLDAFEDSYFTSSSTTAPNPFVNVGTASYDKEVKLPENTFEASMIHGYFLSNSGKFVPSHYGSDGDPAMLYPGESITFTFDDLARWTTGTVDIDEGTVFVLSLNVWYPDEDYHWVFRYCIRVDEDALKVEEMSVPELKITESTPLETGIGYDFEIRNNTGKDSSGYYVILSYNDEMMGAVQLFSVDAPLKDGETYYGGLSSFYCRLSDSKLHLLEFESKAERTEILNDKALYSDWNDSGRGIVRYLLNENVDSEAWLTDLAKRAE